MIFYQLLEPKMFLEVMAFKPLEMQRTREGERLATGHTMADEQSQTFLSFLN